MVASDFHTLLQYTHTYIYTHECLVQHISAHFKIIGIAKGVKRRDGWLLDTMALPLLFPFVFPTHP